MMTDQTLPNRAFAFDGTVLDVQAPDQADPEAESGGMPPYLVTEFQVHEWLTGGDTPDTVSVQMQRDVRPGQRLLVSGEPRWGGEPLDDAIAWECGFTTEHTEARAEQWRTALEED